MPTLNKVAGVAALSLGALWLVNRLGSRVFEVGEFFRPDEQEIQDIAERLPADEDQFILGAWRLVGEMRYENIASSFDIKDTQVFCSACYLPSETLNRNMGNCVAKSALLASILLTRLSPGRIYLAIGDLISGSGPVGHAWLIVRRGGLWYVVEATLPPPMPPWRTVQDQERKYVSHALVSPTELVCNEPNICLRTAADCPCLHGDLNDGG